MTQDEDVLVLLNEGLVCYGLGDVDQAMETWKKVLAMDPGNTRALEYVRFVRENWAPEKTPGSNPSLPDDEIDPKAASAQQAWGPAAADPERALESETAAGAWLAEDRVSSSTLPPYPSPVQSAGFEQSAFSIPPLESQAPEPSQAFPAALSDLSGEPLQPQTQWADADESESALSLVGGGDTDSALESTLSLVGGGDMDGALEPTEDETERLFKKAGEMLDLDDFSGAIELLDKVLDLRPGDVEAMRLREGAEVELLKLFESKLGDLSQVPEVCMAGDEVIWLNLDHRAGFVLSLVDGHTCYDDILIVSGLSEIEGMRILVQLLQEKVIDVS